MLSVRFKQEGLYLTLDPGTAARKGLSVIQIAPGQEQLTGSHCLSPGTLTRMKLSLCSLADACSQPPGGLGAAAAAAAAGASVSSSCELGQQLAPDSPLQGFSDRGLLEWLHFTTHNALKVKSE